MNDELRRVRNATFELSCVRLPPSMIASRLAAHASSSNRRADSRLRLSGWLVQDEAALNVLHRYALNNYNHIEFVQVQFTLEVALQLRFPPNVLSVDIGFMPNQSADEVSAVVAAIVRQPSVVELAITSGSCTWHAPVELARSDSLRDLAIFSNAPLDVSIERAMLALVQRSVVRVLAFDAVASPDHLLELAANLHALESLAVTTSASDACVALLADTLCTNRKLRCLDIEYLELSVDTGDRLARMLARNITLTRLCAGMTMFEAPVPPRTATVESRLIDSVALHNGTLLELFLGTTSIGDTTKLRAALKRNEGIQWRKQRKKILRVLFGVAVLQLPSLVLFEIVQNCHSDYWLLPYFFVMSAINAVSDAANRKR